MRFENKILIYWPKHFNEVNKYKNYNFLTLKLSNLFLYSKKIIKTKFYTFIFKHFNEWNKEYKN